MPTEKYDVIMIGGGPAGLTAAIYCTRAELKTLVLDKPKKLLDKVETIENYFGFPKGISGKELLQRGEEQAEKFGAEIIKEEALTVRLEEENYLVETAEESYQGKGLILAPGIKYEKPSIEKLEDFEGRGVSYCVTCDAPLFKDKEVGLIGSKDYAAKEAIELYEFTDDVTIFTNGREPEFREELREKIEENSIPIVKEKVEKIIGEESLEGLALENRKINLDGIFIAVGTSGSVDFARSLGIPVEEGSIVVNEDFSAGLPRLYAAGDCTGGTKQLAAAVGEGAKAALNLIEDLRGEEYTDWQKN